MIGCYDFDGNEIWTHSWTPRGIMANRQFEPLLVGDVILNVEVLDKSTVVDQRSLVDNEMVKKLKSCLLYTSPSPRDLSTSRMPSSA